MSGLTYTVNYQIPLPNFGNRGWQDDYYEGMHIIDAAIATAINIAAFRGEWKNSTIYSVDDRVVNSEEGVIYSCLVEHTSAATGLMSADIAAHSSYWESYSVDANFRGEWATNTGYVLNDFVVSGSIYAVCVVSHTSGATFASDSARWEYLVDLTDDIAAAAASAAAAAASAAGVSLPSAAGKALQMLRMNAGETSYEFRTMLQVANAIAQAAVSASPTSSDGFLFADADDSSNAKYTAIGNVLDILSNVIVAATATFASGDRVMFSDTSDGNKGKSDTIDSLLAVIASSSFDASYPILHQNLSASGQARTCTLNNMMTALTALSALATNDLVTVSDTSASTVKKVALSDLVPPVNYQIFTASGTFSKSVIPAHLTHCIILVVGAGGGGGGANSSTSKRGTGGGGGGAGLRRMALSDLSASETVTIGAKGVGGTVSATPSAGTNGGTTSFGAHVTATGGVGGAAATGSVLAGVDGGVGTGGDINIRGEQSEINLLGDSGSTSSGGNAAFGIGMGGKKNVGEAGIAYGGGASCANHGGAAVDGADGICIVFW